MNRILAQNVAQLYLLVAVLLLGAPGTSIDVAARSFATGHSHEATVDATHVGDDGALATEFCELCNCCTDVMCSQYHGSVCQSPRCQEHPEYTCTNA